jgi:hypothetical protein
MDGMREGCRAIGTLLDEQSRMKIRTALGPFVDDCMTMMKSIVGASVPRSGGKG